jgi:BMFP domain-containing protein YqiC
MTEEVIQSLDDVLSGKEPAAPEPVATGEQVAEPATPEPAKVEEAPPAAKAKDEPKEDWTKAAVLDERRKRQELERKVAELEAKGQKPEAKPDFFADPDAALDRIKQETQAQLMASRLELTQELMRDSTPDYDELEAEFIDLAKDNPFLIKELHASKNPAKFAYQTAQKARLAASLTDGNALAKREAELRAEIEAKVRAEYEGKAGKVAEKREALAPSLAAAQSKGSINDQPDESLDSILKKGR